jgi:hypothetical protein
VRLAAPEAHIDDRAYRSRPAPDGRRGRATHHERMTQAMTLQLRRDTNIATAEKAFRWLDVSATRGGYRSEQLRRFGLG